MTTVWRRFGRAAISLRWGVKVDGTLDELDSAVRDILIEANLPDHRSAVQLLREAVEIARDTMTILPRAPRLRKREALALLKAAKVLQRVALRNGLASGCELDLVKDLERKADFDLSTGAYWNIMLRRPWLWPACRLLLDVWTDLSFDFERRQPRSAKLYERGMPSPALQFLEDCWQLIDPTVTRSAILRAQEPERSEEEKAAGWEKWLDSPLGKKWSRLGRFG
jgi:hypothetical protein